MVVADTSPLNYLVLTGYEYILPAIHGTVLIPPAVRQELLSPAAPALVRAWTSAPPHWIKEAEPSSNLLRDAELASLHNGERGAIALAASRGLSILLIDEWPARRIAVRKGFRVTGTLGILDEAAHRKLVSLPEAVGKLKATSFRYPAGLVEKLLAQHAD